MFLAHKHHYVAKGKTARKDVMYVYDYHGRDDNSIIIYFGNSSDLTCICQKFHGFLIRKESAIKDTLIWQQRVGRALVQVFSTGSV